ncbi:MAG: LPS export ABC transporter periplasmic protein LptC [Bacteroidales bacterium]|nr:LPS export ABC transporter periplasmic protein LptC [Bacteroidales bacterium]
MKKQLLDRDNILKILNYLKIIPVYTGIIFFVSCEQNKIEKVNALTKELNAPNVSVINSEIIFSENALIRIKIQSPEINRFLNIEEPYTEFPKGIHVEFFDSLQQKTSSIKAKYCIFDETEKLWTAKNNVVGVTPEGDTLNTDFLIWNQATKKIYSDQYVKITNNDGVIHGKGFEADQDFYNWRILKPSGDFYIENEK